MREKDYYGAIKGFCLKWNLPEVWNSDRITGANLIYEVIKVINAMIVELRDYEDRVDGKLDEMKKMIDDFLKMFDEDLSETVYNMLIEWKDSGMLEGIINDALFNQKADKTYVDGELDNKADLEDFNQFKNEVNNELGGFIEERENMYPNSLEKKYGILPKEDNFYDFKFNLYHDNKGYYSDFNGDIYFLNADTYYISQSGNDNNDGTKENPKRTVGNVVQAHGSNTTPLRIVFKDKVISRLETAVTTINQLNCNVSIESETYSFVGSLEHTSNIIITEESGVYKITRSTAFPAIGDIRINLDGVALQLREVNSFNQVQNTSFTYFISDSNTIYINTPSKPNKEDLIIVSGVTTLFFENFAKTIRLKNLNILARTGGNSVRLSNPNTHGGRFIVENCNVDKYNRGNDGVSTYNVNESIIINTHVLNANRDGFNYHTENGINTFAYEENCSASHNGLEHETNNNNISSAHDGMFMLRLATVGSETKGPGIVDVNGCYSVNYGCEAYATRGLNQYSFYFNENGKVRLYNCKGGTSANKGLILKDIHDVKIVGCQFTSVEIE